MFTSTVLTPGPIRFCLGLPRRQPELFPDYPPGLERVAAEFPTVAIEPQGSDGSDGSAGVAVAVDTGAWREGRIALQQLDIQVDELAARGPVIVQLEDPRGAAPGACVEQVALEVLTRCQRWVGRRNQHSNALVFDRVLSAHRELHDLDKPLVRADYDHALDVWQWMLRLDPHASRAAQIAALFHDIERLISEADARVEHHAADYNAFKRAHAARGARMTGEVLASLDIAAEVRERVELLIALHDRGSRRFSGRASGRICERAGADRALTRERELLDDADGLSFFSLNSSGFLDYYGPLHTRQKIAWTLMRLSRRGRERLGEVKLRRDVARLVQEVAGTSVSIVVDAVDAADALAHQH